MFLDPLKLFRLPEPEPTQQLRQILIGGRVIGYRLNSGRRRLSMTVDDRGLRIGAPRRMPLGEIESFLRLHGEWLLQKLDELTLPRHGPHGRQLTIKDGSRVPLLGTETEIRVLPGANRIRWLGDTLILEARPEASSTDMTALTKRALQRRALVHFGARLNYYTAQINHEAPPLGLTSARTRWGSCSSRSGIRVNWRLIHLPAHIGDYVVAHEVAHLLEMNHSPRFWAVVDSLYPDWRNAKAELKQRAASLPIL